MLADKAVILKNKKKFENTYNKLFSCDVVVVLKPGEQKYVLYLSQAI